MTVGVHPFPSRTRQLSPLVPTILGWKRPGTIGRCQHKRKRSSALDGLFSCFWRMGTGYTLLLRCPEWPVLAVARPIPTAAPNPARCIHPRWRSQALLIPNTAARVTGAFRTSRKAVYFGTFCPLSFRKAVALLHPNRPKIPRNLLAFRSKILKNGFLVNRGKSTAHTGWYWRAF